MVGKSLAEVAGERALAPVEMAIQLQREGDRDRPGGGRLRGFSMSEDDVDAYARQLWVATASDGGIALPEDGSVHARFYGTFPRKIRYFALDRDIISVEHAVRSMTSLPARIMGLRDRGMVMEGFAADLVVFDLDEIRDESTFFDPHQHASGIDFVLVNGEFVVDGGELTYGLPGQVITSSPEGAPSVEAH
jgi:N-acyl-D-amino-acid deacylase